MAFEPSLGATAQLMARARRVLAYGGLDGVIQRPLLGDDGTPFPHFAIAAEGCEVVDSLGRRFLDWTNGWGPVLLGYRHPAVEAAIRDQLTAGPTLSLMHPIEVELAERLCEWIPCADMIAFAKNGSDAVTAAVRLAKAVTGRDIILQFGFHGFHDWYTCQHPDVKGIPSVLRSFVEPFPYNDVAALERLFEKHRGRVAGIVMEPVNMFLPEPGYLEAVRALTRREGALLVFDEIVTGFRFASGGAQELYGVVPDLATFGKGLANGMPLSAIAGRREYLQFLPSVGVGMTFRGETLSLAAARAVLDVMTSVDVPAHLARVGEAIRARFHESCRKTGIRCHLSGHPARQTFVFHDQDGVTWQDIRHEFLLHCLGLGVLTNGNLLPSLAIDDAAIDRTAAAFEEALARVRAALSGQRARDGRPHGGFPFGPKARFTNGFVEILEVHSSGLHVSGWALLGDEAADEVEARSRSGHRLAARVLSRPDLAGAFPRSHWQGAGFTLDVPADEFLHDGAYELTLAFRRGDHDVFLCHVMRQVSDATPVPGPFWLGDGVLYV
ncbi:MAG: aminotransferase class III-fold pyridoxal phosphate-dependent enzyme [Planctomycetota bacterium]